jgi:hypothetical protein
MQIFYLNSTINYFTTIWYTYVSYGHFGKFCDLIFPCFGLFNQRKIWQPCPQALLE